jgi:DNA sulfur modification protein DndE
VKLSQIRFSNRASIELKALKARLGITPNVLCRIGFCLSVEDPARLDPEAFESDSDRIIDRHVLLGPYDALLVAMMRQRLGPDDERQDPLDDELVGRHFRAHVHRGVHLLFKRVKSPADLAQLLPPPPSGVGTEADENEQAVPVREEA